MAWYLSKVKAVSSSPLDINFSCLLFTKEQDPRSITWLMGQGHHQSGPRSTVTKKGKQHRLSNNRQVQPGIQTVRQWQGDEGGLRSSQVC